MGFWQKLSPKCSIITITYYYYYNYYYYYYYYVQKKSVSITHGEAMIVAMPDTIDCFILVVAGMWQEQFMWGVGSL